jgi:hypothetical protein
MQLVEHAQAAGKPVLDNLDNVHTVLDRHETRQRLQHIQEATEGLIRWAPAVLVPDRGAAASDRAAQMQSALQQCDALICKPCVACGIPQSHAMRLVWSATFLPPAVCFHACC